MSSIIAKNIQDIYVNTITPLISTSANISATNITTTNLVVTSATIPNIILTGSLNANFNSNTLGNIFTTSGNVGIGTVTPTFKLDISGSTRINSGGSVFLGNPGINLNPNYDNIGMFIDSNTNSLGYRLGLIKKNGSVPSFAVSNNNNFIFQVANTTDASLVSTNTYSTIMTLSTLGNLTITGTSNSVSLSSGNIFSINSSLGTINSTGLTTGNINFTGNLFQNGVSYLGSQWTTTAGNLSYTSGNVVVTNLSVGNSITTASLLATTSISSGSIYSTNLTSSNIYASSTFSAASALLTTATVSTLAATNISSSNMTISSILATTSISSSGLYSTNVTSTNIVGTAISAANISSTSISSAAIYSLNQTTTNIVGTSISAANISSTSISSSALYSLNQTSTNIVATTISASSITSTSISSAGLFSLNQTTTNAVHTTLTSANIFTTTTGSVLSDGLNLRVGGSILTISNSKGAYTFGSDPTDTNRQVYLVSNIPGTSNILTFRNTTTNILYDFINEGTGRNRFVIQQSNNASTINPYFIIDPTNPSISLMSNTGINTTSPAFTLDVSGSTRINNTLLATFNSNTIGNLFTTGGNVGINITSPAFTLDVNGSTRITGPGIGTNGTLLLTGGDSFGHTLYIASSTVQKRTVLNNTGTVGNLFSYDYVALVPLNLQLQGFGGNVGIGTSSPAFSLDVNGSGRFTGNINLSGGSLIPINNITPIITYNGNVVNLFQNTTITAGSGLELQFGQSQSANNNVVLDFNYTASGSSTNSLGLGFYGANNKLVVQASGNVGIGTATPRANLEITQSSSTTGTMLYSGLNDGGINRIIFNHSSDTSLYQKVQIQTQAIGSGQSARANFAICVNTVADNSNAAFTDNKFFISGTSGNVGISTSVPNGLLQISNTALFSTNGNLTCTGDVLAYGSISDQRLKTNVQTITSNFAIDIVKKLNPVTFNWRDDIFNKLRAGQSDSGFIAQEVNKVLQHAVGEYTHIETGTVYKNLRHERIIPYLTTVIQNLLERVNKLENKK